MGRSWLRLGGWVAGVYLVVLAGCVPAQHRTSGTSGQESSPTVKTEVKASEGEKSAQTQGAEATQQQAAPMPPPPPSPPEPSGYRVAGDAPLVTERIRLYQQKKDEWAATGANLAGLGTENAWPDSWNECLQDIEVALAGYQRLQTALEQGLDPWEVVGRDLHYFAKECNQVLATAQAKLSGSQDLSVNPVPESAINQVRQYFEAGQYQEVITAYEALPKGKDGTLPGPRELKLWYGRALVKLGRLQESAGILTTLLAEVSQSVDLAALEARLLTADVLLAVGQVEEARQVYAGLVKALAPVVSQQEWVTAHIQAFGEQASAEDLAVYRELLQAYLSFDGKQVPQALIDGVARVPGLTSTPFAVLAKMLLAKATAQSQDWARGQLTKIRALVAVRNLERARELLEQLAATAPVTMKSSITQLESEIAHAELAAQEGPKPSAEERPASPWEEALSLFEQQKYDEAIAGFQALVDSEHGAEANAKIAEASELAAAALRRQAAALYAKAKKTFDPDAKRQGLLSSRTLLLALIEKYPTTSIVDKARLNLKVLEVELGQPATTPPPLPASVTPN